MSGNGANSGMAGRSDIVASGRAAGKFASFGAPVPLPEPVGRAAANKSGGSVGTGSRGVSVGIRGNTGAGESISDTSRDGIVWANSPMAGGVSRAAEADSGDCAWVWPIQAHPTVNKPTAPVANANRARAASLRPEGFFLGRAGPLFGLAFGSGDTRDVPERRGLVMIVFASAIVVLVVFFMTAVSTTTIAAAHSWLISAATTATATLWLHLGIVLLELGIGLFQLRAICGIQLFHLIVCFGQFLLEHFLSLLVLGLQIYDLILILGQCCLLLLQFCFGLLQLFLVSVFAFLQHLLRFGQAILVRLFPVCHLLAKIGQLVLQFHDLWVKRRLVCRVHGARCSWCAVSEETGHGSHNRHRDDDECGQSTGHE